jgi:serine phosphatase RsbU (regulator of sigma subunit)
MVKNYVLIISMLLMKLTAFSQSQYYIDSLTAKVKTDKAAFDRAIDYFQLSEEVYDADTTKGNLYWQNASTEASGISDATQKLQFRVKEFYHYFNRSQSSARNNFFSSGKAKSILDELGQSTKVNPAMHAKYYVAWGMYMTHKHKECDSSHVAIEHSFDTAISIIGTKDNEELARAYIGEMLFYTQDEQREKITAKSEKAIAVFSMLNAKLREKYFFTLGYVLDRLELNSKVFVCYNAAYTSALQCHDSLTIGDVAIKLASVKLDVPLEECKIRKLKAIDMLKRNNNLNPKKVAQNIMRVYFWLGNNYYKPKNDTVNCLNSFRIALSYVDATGDHHWRELILGDMGQAFLTFGYLDSALVCQKKSLTLRIESGNREGEMYSYHSFGNIYLAKGDMQQAINWENKAVAMSEKYGVHNWDDQFFEVLQAAYLKQGNYKQAYDFLKRYYLYKDSISKVHNEKQIYQLKNEEKEAKLTADFDKKTAVAAADQEKKDAISKADSKRQKLYILFSLIIAIVLGGVAIVVFRSLKTTRKQKAEIEIQKTLVEQQKDLVEEKNKEILDSITYAKRLQDAILPPLNLVKQYLPESFVLYKPKDIVAGDFYWMERAGDNILIAAADCTGHGVPGALVSVVCSNALNRTVKEFKITQPGKILDKVRELVLETFEKSESNVQDGMDISLCCINTKTNEVQWSGAYNSLWYIHNGAINEVNADKQPIGKHDKPLPFNTHNINLQKGDTMYLFTDGYADQFGGPKGKKFKYKALQEKLLAFSQQAMSEQRQMLDKAIEDWKGNLEQVDDILIIGVKV